MATTRRLLVLLLAVGPASCLSADGPETTGTGGTPGTGGVASTGGAPGSGGLASSGGAPGSGGAPSSGGAPGTGGAASGGRGGSGGAATGGATATGGRGTGGAPTGGAPATGGRGTGGAATGGAATGGRGTGGATTGGASGSGGVEGWLTGYTATMFGNHSMGDCTGISNFSDMTNISGANCTYQGVTIASYSSSTANNASFYGAPGDESSMWMGPLCKCQPGQNETNGVCPSAPTCAMEQNCGKCFEVRCDPNGTGTYSNGDTRMGAMYCNARQSAVIQIIDACPHNHPQNTWWCTNQRRNHIDISCSAMKGIIGNANNAGSWGWVNVQVRAVDCSVGLGVKMN